MKDTRSLFSLSDSGMDPGDDAETRLKKSLLIFATGLVSLGAIVWLFLYWQLGPQFSATPAIVFQLLLVGNLLLYFRTRNFDFFRHTQLALFLFVPFVVQWSIGNFITASGVSLWGLLAPIGAVLILGPRESLSWFAAYLFLTALSGFIDYFMADFIALPPAPSPQISSRTSVFFFALNFAAISTIAYLLLRYATVEKERAQEELETAHSLLKDEQERSERLLLNILPAPIAERLKHDKQTIADGFADVTVMFADIVNFTRVAEGLSPQQVFAMLNRIFSSFDELAERFGMEKIKTIGDAYMVAGGLNSGPENYSVAMAEMALAMRDLLQRDDGVNHLHLEIRIGIGTGPVVAGVVGKKKFIYDLWGDTVNLASRITSEGVPGMIQVDNTTWKRLRDHFEFHDPQTLYLKGKGDTEVHRLIGPRSREPSAAEPSSLTAGLTG
ncbi:MAG TPA: adenylate/guanylate cyclase domain-containing protein [Rhodocyclaceae bacterium]|nr:adenylate/guanylate cyclase domain-containing protein [Betaproteobacteria bacterium]HMV01495.1 adenylate/guanylate cyclase domain-containing protein [Rhodocyclaceae bacterium]HNE44510.1 adenylate/guanylate cyclase domain-containing protein [Rhodocyclaceae bacterium]HNP05279.1 adenylate/guanylate cyclase domain-containing protein [Rhodocyclaceae bacterium]